ncbi:MaoC/PaaZ C-terminal domain-containing protein [Streptomyces sp. NPDC056653]|uniref:MaoC/PaaZ C-terminal domain-containing protein n=1 Tax=Streptomyces sp. NPDC056653 TaxID=3345894 RepID=UPI00368D93B3
MKDLRILAVGDELPPLALPPITRTTLALFAGSSGDHNPIHIDIDAARAAGEPDVFAHGMLSMAYLGTLLTTHLPQAQLRTWTVRFVAKTPVHAAVTCRGTVREIHDHDDGRTVVLDVETQLVDGTTTLRGSAEFRTDPTTTEAGR